MQPSVRQQELERLYNSRRGHVPQISISDDNYHVTEALGSYYGDEASSPQSPSAPAPSNLGLGLDKRDIRPLSFVHATSESIDHPQDQQQQQQLAARKSRRNGSYFETKRAAPIRTPLATAQSNERVLNAMGTSDSGDMRERKRVSGLGSESGSASPPPLNRSPSTDTAVQQFPLNDIDYESSAAAVAQELSNLQAIRRMSMNVDAADPDLPTFSAGGLMPAVAPTGAEDENDTARLFWVPARLHPELAPKEFKTFIEDRVDKIRRRSGDADSLSPEGLERSGSGSSLRRKKSMLSHQIDTKGSYEDGAERLERKRSNGMSLESQTRVDLSELETLVSDPAQLMRRMSLDTSRRSLDSGVEMPENEDMAILPPLNQSLKRSTRTAYRKGSLRKGERVPLAKRAQNRQTESDGEETASGRASLQLQDEPVLGLTRVQTEPVLQPQASMSREEFPPRQSSISRRQKERESFEDPSIGGMPQDDRQQQHPSQHAQRRQSGPPSQGEEHTPASRPQHRQFQSRLAAGPGRTTAQLPGYNNTNPLPNIIETMPDGTKVPVGSLIQQISDRRASLDTPEPKRSHDLPRPFQRSGAHGRPVFGRERASTLDDLSSNPTPLPGSGGIGTDSLTLVPTFEDRKVEKKDAPRKSTWKWVFGSDDDDKKASKEDKSSESGTIRSLKNSRLYRQPAEKARLDVLQNSIDTNAQPRGRESLVLNRDDIRLDDERKKDSGKRSFEKKEKESGLLSAIFGGKKKSSDGESKKDKRASKIDRMLSPDLVPRILKPDIDYNWTRFSILEERAIYRMAHIKLANPRRALHSQVLLSNFMYSYLAKVQMMHPQVQIPAAHQRSQQRGQQQQQKQDDQPAEYSQYQRWQQQQDREEMTGSPAASVAESSPQTQPSYDAHSDYLDDGFSTPAGTVEYDARESSEDYEYDAQHHQQQHQSYHTTSPPSASPPSSSQWSSGTHRGGGGHSMQISDASTTYTDVEGGSYSVAGTHDYLGYPTDGRPFDSHTALWEEDEERNGSSRREGTAADTEGSLW